MKKLAMVSALALVIGFSGNALAQQNFGAANAGGYTGPSAASMTVAEAKKLGDDTPVVLIGKLEKSLGGEKYLFTDNTGSVTVEIDNDDWRGLTVNDKDTVEIRGEDDKDFMNIEIDVEAIAKK